MHKPASVRPLLTLALLGWAGLGIVVTQVNPYPSTTVSRLAFFVLLYVALLGSLSLIAFLFNFRLFGSKQSKGDMAQSLQQGALWSAFFVTAAAMQAAHAMSFFTGIILLAIFGLAGFIVLTRR